MTSPLTRRRLDPPPRLRRSLRRQARFAPAASVSREAAFASLSLVAALVVAPAQAQSHGPGPLQLRIEPALGASHPEPTESGRPIFARGSRASGRPDRELTLEGEAEIRHAGTVVRGNRITWYEDDEELVAVGNVRVVRGGSVFVGEGLQLRLDSSTGSFRAPTYELPLYDGRGEADRLDFLGGRRVGLVNATYTTCQPEDPDWYLRADELTIDEERGEGRGRGARLYFKDVQLLGVPYFGFPLGDQRRSGVLAPSFSMSSKTGAELMVPYYWNMAPNRDMTLYPRVMAKRGVMLGTEYRYLDPRYHGTFDGEYIARDNVTGEKRYQWSWLTRITNLGGWAGQVNLNGVSDDNYFVDYSRSIMDSSERSLARDAYLARAFGDWTVLGRVSKWQNILEARLAPPYEREPQVQARYTKREWLGFDFTTTLDATRFVRPLAGAVEGLRVFADNELSYPVMLPGGFIVPKVGLHLSSYDLDNNPLGDDRLDRVLPTFSVDAGLVFERDTRVFDRPMLQTLEPRLFYVRTPYRDQSEFPVFDTGVADFNFAQLFSTNTFVGSDRIADANHLTTAVISRFIEPATGAERFRVALGQRLYFNPQRVALRGVGVPTDRRSDVLLAASGDFGNGMTLDGGLQWSVRESRVPRMSLSWRYLPEAGKVVNVGVRYLRDEIGQFDTSWRWPVSRRWVAMGRLNYSWAKTVRDPLTLRIIPAEPGFVESVLGFEYRRDCWIARFVVQRFTTAAFEKTTAFFLQLEFRGVGHLGSDPFDILTRNIRGYQSPSDRPAQPGRFFGYE
ncbi:MAG: LPS-assembly protein LptD [Burkholderiaceae bacterium]|nr:LPS-assembly protein LptD [Burkholderiaceae bacterium]